MKFKQVLFASISLLFLHSPVRAKEGTTSSVYGKILLSKKTIFGLTSPYYVTFEHEGKVLAYPIETSSKVMAEKLKEFVDKDTLLEGDIRKTTFKADGQIYTIETFVPESIRPLELKELSLTAWTLPDRPVPEKEKKKDNSVLILGENNPNEGKLAPTRGPKAGLVGFRINDSVANALIFTGAAAIIGSELLRKK